MLMECNHNVPLKKFIGTGKGCDQDKIMLIHRFLALYYSMFVASDVSFTLPGPSWKKVTLSNVATTLT